MQKEAAVPIEPLADLHKDIDDVIQDAYTNFDDMRPDESDFVSAAGQPSCAMLFQSHAFDADTDVNPPEDTADLEDDTSNELVQLWNSVDSMMWEDVQFREVVDDERHANMDFQNYRIEKKIAHCKTK